VLVTVLAMRHLRLLSLSALLLAACSSPAPAPPKVASLVSASPTATASAAGTRPQLRLDTSDAERDRLFTAYDDCLVAHGVKVNPVDQPGPAGPGRRLDQSGEPKSAYVACKDKLPLQPPELDEDRNPNYAAQWNDNVKCLRAHGLMVHVTKPGEWTWDSSDSVVPANEEQIEKACELEAFGHGSSQ
jgi:hypothetical protein